jgi:predicted DNA-binding ribbon-helix-helix protein
MSGVAMKRTTVGFSEPFYLRLQEVAAEHGISVSQLIREGVLFYLAYEQGSPTASRYRGALASQRCVTI